MNRIPRRLSRNINGFTLIEVVSVIAATGVILIASIKLFSAATQTHRGSLKLFAAIQNNDRLTQRLRHDAAIAKAVSGEGSSLVLECEGEEVQYAIVEEQQFERRIVRAGEVIGRDRTLLPRSSRMYWAVEPVVDGQRSQALLKLLIEDVHPSDHLPLRIWARIGTELPPPRNVSERETP